ncbi:CDP-archaeol synthase [Methylomarinum sp. Ch1-1]|uniref:CDP-archaeol synthase n=1 Tax=Methylomarinum roseum TaxID=3067653 RepID=A0AAU7NW13_9GAMM|nr:CDP-archaeol synthase [Methylomarinum sp. Ch1-1]MDP4522734.1 CDP-archaeol synthase [Methylomarinum sp. Ch1-1]
MTLCWQCIVKTFLLLAIANGAPVLARKLFGSSFGWPVDFGIAFFDKRPLFGHSKTWRGLFASVLMTMLLAPLVNIEMFYGASLSVMAMLGDLLASFCKRRLGYRESSRCRMLDTIPEALLPLLVLHQPLELSMLDVMLCVLLFFGLEIFLSPMLYRLHIRKRPY